MHQFFKTLKVIHKESNSVLSGGKNISFASLIVLGGCLPVEAAARKAGHNVNVPFSPGRADASQEQTDVGSFALLEPKVRDFVAAWSKVMDLGRLELA